MTSRTAYEVANMHLSLAYAGSGEYSKVLDALRVSGLNTRSDNRYFLYNVFTAMSVQGVIDPVWTHEGIRWVAGRWVTNRKLFPDDLYGDELLCSDRRSEKIYVNDIPIGYSAGSKQQKSIQLKDFSPIGEVVDHVLHEEKVNEGRFTSIERYDFDTANWDQVEDMHSCTGLYRLRTKYYGSKYFIYLHELERAYLVSEPEWTYVAGAYLIGRDIRSPFRIDRGGKLSIKGGIRLPLLIYRKLYSESCSMNVSYEMSFEGVPENAVNEVIDYLCPGSKYE